LEKSGKVSQEIGTVGLGGKEKGERLKYIRARNRLRTGRGGVVGLGRIELSSPGKRLQDRRLLSKKEREEHERGERRRGLSLRRRNQ